MNLNFMKRTRLLGSALLLSMALVATSILPTNLSGRTYAADGAAQAVSPDAYVAWWMHDATGYHPAIYLQLVNTSGADLSWKPIKFQGLFRDLKNGYVTVARYEMRQEFHPNQQVYLLLEGPKAFELPIDKNAWPLIEAKVMCRVGADDDSATVDVLVTKLAQEAMTDEEARIKLADYSYPRMLSRNPRVAKQRPPEPVTPLVATALPLSGSSRTPKSDRKGRGNHGDVTKLGAGVRTAGLGDDFYAFEQAFGKPLFTRFQPDTRWTWAQFQHEQRINIFAGSNGVNTSRVDFVVAMIPAEAVQQDSELMSIAKSFAGKMKSQVLSSPTKTVKYLNTGRMQLTTAHTSGYKMFAIAPRGPGDDNSYVLGVCVGLFAEPRAVLADNAKRIPMLRPLAAIVADE